jgi:hypothetical protein
MTNPLPIFHSLTLAIRRPPLHTRVRCRMVSLMRGLCLMALASLISATFAACQASPSSSICWIARYRVALDYAEAKDQLRPTGEIDLPGSGSLRDRQAMPASI